MANNKDFKVKNGIQPTAYHEGLGTVTSSASTVPYDLSTVSYDSVSFSVATQSTIPSDIVIGDNDTKMFICSDSGNAILQYSLSTAKDISTASYDSVSFSVNSQDATPQGLTFKPDGTKMYVVGNSNRRVYQYSLSTAWDLSTASYDNKSYYVYSQEQNPETVAFSSDGTKMYVAGQTAGQIFQYTLSTAWDVSTASYDSVSLNPADSLYNRNIIFSPDGTKMYNMGGGAYKEVDEYSLSTAWDLSTATYTSNSFDWSTEESVGGGGISLSSDGTKLYLVGSGNDTVYQYSIGSTLNTAELDLSTGSVFEITPTSDIQINLSNPADSGTVSQATLLLDGAVVSLSLGDAVDESKTFSIASQSPNSRDIFFSSDGLKMFTFEDVYLAPYVYAYDLSVAWDVSTASYNGESFDPSANINQLEAGQFSSDGTKLYIVDAGFQDIFQYTLSTAWDLSTASYDSKSFDPSQTSIFDAIAFNDDGTKMYISAASGGVVYQYTLSTAWDISTASYDSKSFDFSTQNSNVRALFFTEDGYSVFSLDYNSHAAYSYTMTTAFDISTASYTNTNYVFSPVNLYGMFVDEGSGKLYIASDSTDTVYQYSIGSPATITYPSTLEWPSGTAPTSPAVGETDVLTFSTTDGGTTYQAVQAISGAS
jgi:hypothetical protein